MKGFRISVVGVMTLVAVAAADCLVLRWFFVRGSETILLVSGLLPLVNVLAFGMWLGLRGLVARRRCPSFPLGLQVFGWAAAAVYTIVCVLPSADDLVMAYFGVVLTPVDTLLGRLGLVYDDSSVSWRLLSYACSSAALSAPLLVFGLVGGYLTHRFEIWLARGAWSTSGERYPATSA